MLPNLLLPSDSAFLSVSLGLTHIFVGAENFEKHRTMISVPLALVSLIVA